MDSFQFISSLTNSLAWPTAIVILVIIFRSPLKKLLEGLTRLRYGDFEIDFGTEMQSIKDRALIAGMELATETISEQTATRDSVQIIADALKLAEEFPEPAVVLAWTAIECELLEVELRFDIPANRRGHNVPVESIKLLRKHGYIDSDTCEVLDRMRKLRNIAAHPARERARISSDKAVEFISLTEAVTEKLKGLKPGFNTKGTIR